SWPRCAKPPLPGGVSSSGVLGDRSRGYSRFFRFGKVAKSVRSSACQLDIHIMRDLGLVAELFLGLDRLLDVLLSESLNLLGGHCCLPRAELWPETINDQFAKPLIPVALRELLGRQVLAQFVANL